MSRVELRHLTKNFGGAIAVDDVNLTIEEGEFVVFLGPSGCGKTTTLRMIAGFEYPTAGQILIGGEDVTKIPPRQRQIGMVFQNYALFPTMTVAENVAFGLRQRGLARHAINARVEDMLRLAQLAAFRDRYPAELSGGQQQRVALIRALANSPRMLLMDEPLAALDLKLREAMQIELKQIQRKLGITTVFVTHDQQEAMSLADRIVVMASGHIQQIGTPGELYERPNSQFVAEFVGKNNIFTGVINELNGAECTVDLANNVIVVIRKPQNPRPGGTVIFALRPEVLTMTRQGKAVQRNAVTGSIEQRQYFGNRTHYFVALPWRKTLIVELAQGTDEFMVGEDVIISWETQDCVLLHG
jgi:spermidine/putrescine ABC transporter ATP-binding subunit